MVNQFTHNIAILLHIMLAIITVSVLTVAAICALLTAYQAKHLHAQTQPSKLPLPALQTMESLLFRTITVGFGLLTLMLLSCLYFFFTQGIDDYMMEKSALALLAWTTFTTLLIGRYRFGWRGKRAIYGTLIGLGLLIFTYLISIS